MQEKKGGLFEKSNEWSAVLENTEFPMEDIERFTENIQQLLPSDLGTKPVNELSNVFSSLKIPEFTEAERIVIDLMDDYPVKEVIEAYSGDFRSPEMLLWAFVERSRQKLNQVLTNNEEATALVQKLATKNHEWLIRNQILNWMRIAGIVPPIDTEVRYSEEMVDYVTNEKPNTRFTSMMTGYTNGPPINNLVENRDIIEDGPGNGRDTIAYIAADASTVECVEKSPTMHRLLQKRKESLPEDQRDKMIVRKNPESMEAFFDNRIKKINDNPEEARKLQADTIVDFSVMHYFSDEEFLELATKKFACLRPGGHWAFGVKVLGKKPEDKTNIYTMEGILLENEKYPIVFNSDGMIRHFRTIEQNQKLAEQAGFAKKEQTIGTIDYYETPNSPSQHFANYVFQKPTNGGSDHTPRN